VKGTKAEGIGEGGEGVKCEEKGKGKQRANKLGKMEFPDFSRHGKRLFPENCKEKTLRYDLT